MEGKQGDSLEVSEGTGYEFELGEWEQTEIEFHYGGAHCWGKVSYHQIEGGESWKMCLSPLLLI